MTGSTETPPPMPPVQDLENDAPGKEQEYDDAIRESGGGGQQSGGGGGQQQG